MKRILVAIVVLGAVFSANAAAATTTTTTPTATTAKRATPTETYKVLLTQSSGRKVAAARFNVKAHRVTVTLSDGTKHVVVYPSTDTKTLEASLRTSGAKVKVHHKKKHHKKKSGGVSKRLIAVVLLVVAGAVVAVTLIVRRRRKKDVVALSEDEPAAPADAGSPTDG